MSNHTEGPWVIGYGPSECLSVMANGRDLAWVRNLECGLRDTSRSFSVDCCNAKLISAAPDLLEALETLVNLVHEGRGLDHASKVARAAIAKARGEV